MRIKFLIVFLPFLTSFSLMKICRGNIPESERNHIAPTNPMLLVSNAIIRYIDEKVLEALKESSFDIVMLEGKV
jgi:hypothetical protein